LFEDHDLSAAAFCREFSLPYASFLKWRRELSASPGRAKNLTSTESALVEFVEVIAESSRSSMRDLVAELELGSEYVLRVFRADR